MGKATFVNYAPLVANLGSLLVNFVVFGLKLDVKLFNLLIIFRLGLNHNLKFCYEYSFKP